MDKEEGFGGFWEIRNLGGGVFGAADGGRFLGEMRSYAILNFFLTLMFFFKKRFFIFKFLQFFQSKKTFLSVFSIPFFRSSKKSGPPLLQILEKHFSTEKKLQPSPKKTRYFVSSNSLQAEIPSWSKKNKRRAFLNPHDFLLYKLL